MKNKEIENKETEELNDEALDEVTGGVFEPRTVTKGSRVADAKTLQATKPKLSGEITVPTVPGIADQRKF